MPRWLHRRASSEEDDDGTPAGPITVVIADRHALVRQRMRSVLEGSEGIRVAAEADHLALAERHVAGHRPDVLVLDLGMSDGSSTETIAALRSRLAGTEIVLVSVEDGPGFARRALAGGARGYVLKDLADEDLAAAVRAAAGGHEYLSASVAKRAGASPAPPAARR
jgi:two-component system response regulator NreC